MNVGSSRHKALNICVSTHIHTHIHTCVDGNLKPRSQCLSGREDSVCCLQIRGHCVHILIVICSVLSAMRNVSDRRCRENENILLYSITFFSKTMKFMRQCVIILSSRAGHRWRMNFMLDT